ncbi:MAG: NUDIX hydrolase [Caldilineales bacterium]|nr:NUDIX hydrolase [Caldilineales bacterium]MDW8316249.1 NUDIX hydrolase [Anaerolineae bacterium]
MVQPWQIVASREAFHNRWLHVTLDTVRLPDGQLYEYTTIRRDKVGVAAVVFNPQGQMLLEQEYRLPVGEVIYQLPGGLADPGEDYAQCIRRELQEETGLVAGEMRYLGSFWNNPASSNSTSVVYLCRDVQPGGSTNHDTAEFVTWDWYDLEWVKARVLDGTIRERVVICALAYLWLSGEIV